MQGYRRHRSNVSVPEEFLMEPVERQTVSVAEAAAILGISRAHAYDCVKSGELPSISLGRRVVISRRVLDGLLDHGRSSSEPAVSRVPATWRFNGSRVGSQTCITDAGDPHHEPSPAVEGRPC